MKKTILSALVLAFATTSASADKLDLTTPEGGLDAMRKIQCGTEYDKPAFWTWEGTSWGRRQGEADKFLFKVVGMNVRQCAKVEGPGQSGTGYRLVSREIMLYIDPRTNKPLKTWKNPYLAEQHKDGSVSFKEVDVLHVANDPVNQGAQFPRAEDGTPRARFFGRIQNNSWFMTAPVPLFYHNVLQGDYQRYEGGAYHATELFNFMGDVESLVNTDTELPEAKVGWVRIAGWLPWMEMAGREGTMYTQAAGQMLKGYDDLPQVMKDYIEEHEPDYKAPPPGDDDRPNETSWTYFKKKVEGAPLPRGGH